MHEYLIDIASDPQIILRAPHDEDRIKSLGIGVIGALRRYVAADSGIYGENHAIGGRIDDILAQKSA
jgi:hypothetical protein